MTPPPRPIGLLVTAAAVLALGAATPALAAAPHHPAREAARKQAARKAAAHKARARKATARKAMTRRRQSADAAVNLLANGSFEGSLAGWAGWNATLARVGGGVDGASSVRVSVTGSATDFSIYPSPRPVSSTAAAELYTADAWIRSSSAPRKVCLRVRELAGSSVSGSAERCATSSTSWQQLPAVTYTTKGAGRQLDAYLYVWGSAKGDSFDADEVTLARGASAPPTPPPTTGGTASGLTATGLDSAHIALAWPAVAAAASYRVLRGAVEVGRTTSPAFTDTLLWPQTTYGYTVQALDGSGAQLSAQSVSGTTTALPLTGFPRPFASTSFWNSAVPAGAATSAQSSALVEYFTAHATRSSLTIGAWSVPVAESHPSDRAFAVPCTLYACTLGAFGAFRIPSTAKADTSSDGHLAVYDPAANREWDFWQGAWNGSSWSASAGAAVSMDASGLAPAGTGAGDAANFPLLGGLIRPEEIAQGHIDHALVYGIQGIGAGAPVCPATHNAPTSTDPSAAREGTHLQLDPSVDVNALPIPAYAKIVARALQTYGMYLRDSSGSLGIYAENPLGRGYNPWPSVLGIAAGNDYPSLAGIPWSRFRVLAAPDYPNC